MQCFPTLRKKKGSVLVFSLIILSFMLVSALSVAVISVTEKRASLATDKSSRAFQVADTGVEVMLEKIYKGNPDTLLDLGDCDNGDVSDDSADYVVSFYTSDGTKLTDCNDPVSQVSKIKSEGTAGNTRRAVEVGIESDVCLASSVTVPGSVNGNNYDTVSIGTQCWMKENIRVGVYLDENINQTNNAQIEQYMYNGFPYIGGLYQWNEAMQYDTAPRAQGICPSGWHIPDDSEWFTLENFLSASSCGTTRNGPGCSPAGTELKLGGSSGFEANLGGFVNATQFFGYDNIGWWWSSSGSGSTAWTRQLRLLETDVHRVSASTTPGFGVDSLSVRCLQD